MGMRDDRWLNQKTGAVPSSKKRVINPLGVYAGKSEKVVYGKHYQVRHHFFVDAKGNVVKI